MLCPEGAITEINKEIGFVEKAIVKGIEFIRGTLTIGSALAPPVIKKVKSRISKDKLNIIDSPPGTSCPMINAVSGSDYCILVTEPTPFGLNDLKSAVESVRKLEIPFGVIINRAGLGDKIIEDYLFEEKIPLLLKIPFNKLYAKSYANGNILIEDYPNLKQDFLQLWNFIEGRIKA